MKKLIILFLFIPFIVNSQTINNNSYQWTKTQRFDKHIQFKDSVIFEKYVKILKYLQVGDTISADSVRVGNTWLSEYTLSQLGTTYYADNGIILDGDTFKLDNNASLNNENIDISTTEDFQLTSTDGLNEVSQLFLNVNAEKYSALGYAQGGSSSTLVVNKNGIYYLKDGATVDDSLRIIRKYELDSTMSTSFKSSATANQIPIAVTTDSVRGTDSVRYVDNTLRAMYYSVDTNATEPTYRKGTFYWNDVDKTMGVQVGGGVTLSIGSEMHEYCQNNSGSLIANGKAVYVYNAGGETPRIKLADNRYIPTAYKTIGIATQDIPHGSSGKVTVYGKVHDQNTNGLIEGNDIYLTTNGDWSQTKPTNAHIIKIGSVRYAHSSNGIIEVSIHRESMPAFKVLDYDANSGISLDTTGITQFYNSVTKFATDINGNITTGNYQATSIDTSYTNAVSNVTATSPLSVTTHGKRKNISGTNLITGNGSGTDNQLVTYTGTNAVQNESALTYNGTSLVNSTASGYMASAQFFLGTSVGNRPIWSSSGSGYLCLNPNQTIGWSATANVGAGSDDLEIGRDAAGILGIYTTFQKTGIGTLKAKLIIPNATLQVTPLANYFENDGTRFYGTDNTGTPFRRSFIMDNGTLLTNRRLPFATTSGFLKDTIGFEFAGGYLDVPGLKIAGSVFTPITLRTFGDVGTGAVEYNGTTKANGKFYGGTSDPDGSTRGNYDGHFYASKLYSSNQVYAGTNISDNITIGTSNIIMTSGGNTIINISPTTDAATSPYIFKTSINHTSNNIFELYNLNSLKFNVDYTGKVIAEGGARIGTSGSNTTISANGYIILPAGSTTAGTAPLKFTTQASGLATVEQGAMELIGNSLQFTNLAVRRAIVQNSFLVTSDVAVTNTTTETEIASIPHGANYLEVGKKENTLLQGTINSVSGAGANTLTIRVKYAGTTYATFVIIEAARTTQNIEIHVMTTCRAIGNGTTSIQIHARSEIDNETNDATINTLATGLNSTIMQATSVTAEWSDASASNSLVILQGECLSVDKPK